MIVALAASVEGARLILDAARLAHDVYVAREYRKTERERAEREHERIVALERRLAELEKRAP